MIKKIILLLTLYILISIFLNYHLVQINIIYICTIFFKNIFPSLFIFFILSSILINYDIVKYIDYILGPILKYLYNLNKYTSYVLIMSLFSGIPANAKYINELLDNKLITKEEGQKILLFSHFANPLFVMSICPTNYLLVLISHYLPNFIIGLFLRNNQDNITSKDYIKKSKSFTDTLIDSINNSFHTLFMILGLIIFFYTISILTNSFILKYLLEMSSSLYYILSLNINLKIKIMLITGILSFGGICVHMQVFSILKNKKISYYPYLLTRLIHFMMSSLIIYFIY